VKNRKAAHLSDQVCGTPVEGPGRATEELADRDVAGLAADQGEKAVPVEGADHVVPLEMAHARAVLGAGRSLGCMPFAGEPAAAIAAVAFAERLPDCRG